MSLHGLFLAKVGNQGRRARTVLGAGAWLKGARLVLHGGGESRARAEVALALRRRG